MRDKVKDGTINDGEAALTAFVRTWPYFVNEAQEVLGSELLYQAVLYHCLRTHGEVPIHQLGMNVKMHIDDVVSPYLKMKAGARAGCESVPDVGIFRTELGADFRRRNYEKTFRHMLLAIEMKVSENDKTTFQPGKVLGDIAKAAALRTEARYRGQDLVPAMVVVDTAPYEWERLTTYGRREVDKLAEKLGVCLFYVGPEDASAYVPDEFAK